MDTNWDDLRIFAAAYEAGTFSRAAEELGIGQATVSRRIAALEEQIGHRLFDRLQSGLVATAAAESLRPYAENVASSIRDATAMISGFEATPSGVVRVAVPPGLAVDLFPLILPELRRRYPALCIDLLSDNLVRDVDRRETDIALRIIRPRSGDLVVSQIAQSEMGLFASPSYLATLPKRPRLEHLDFISWSDELGHIPMARWVHEHASRPPVFTTNSFLSMRAAAVHGLGVILLPDVQARLVGLRPVPVRWGKIPKQPLYMVAHRALRQVPRVAVVVDFLRDVIKAIHDRNEPSWLASLLPDLYDPNS